LKEKGCVARPLGDGGALLGSLGEHARDRGLAHAEYHGNLRHGLASVDASARTAAKLNAIAARQAAALPVPSERPITLERVGDVYSAVPASACHLLGRASRGSHLQYVGSRVSLDDSRNT
jgi:hypothetical protein